MKKRNVLLLVLILAIGFASVSTTLVINGTLNLGFNSNFSEDIVFTRAITPYGNASINGAGKEITFETEKVENVGQKSTLEYDIANKSREYDASVTINCGLKDTFESYSEYVTITQDLTSPFTLNAGETKVGHVTVEMIKAYDEALTKDIEFECKLVASPVEKDTLGDEYVKPLYKEEILNGADPVLTSTNTRSTGKELIPVTLKNNGEVTYADISKEWYNYSNKNWANAVILIDNPSRNYTAGNIIKEEDIESYFVWIPRYKYQIFDEGNYTSAISSKPTESIAKEIQIEFESKDTPASNGTTKNSWLTHPAFTNFDVSGIWVGKFETGYKGATTKAEAQVNENDSSKVIIKPNVYSWRGTTLSNMFKTAYNYNRGLDSHMVKNTEWGAVAYLSHTKYGINEEIRINNNSAFLTGYAATDETNQSSHPGETGTDSTKTQAYNTEIGYKASTTGNITGIYDMSGGAWEYVAAYMPSSQDKSGFLSTELVSYAKYLDLYSTDSTMTSWNKRILGDATGEMGPFYYYTDTDNKTRYHNNWYSDYSDFIGSAYPWFVRSGHNEYGLLAGQFSFARFTGAIHGGGGSRLVLAPTEQNKKSLVIFN